MCAVVSSGLEKLSAHIKASNEKKSSEIVGIRQTLADFFAFGNAYFNSPQKSPVHSHIFFFAPTTQWYTLNRNIVTVAYV